MARAAKPVYVLGTGLSHDGSACLLRDGRVAVAIEKERITRRKHDGGNDDAAIQYCLEAEGIALDDVELVVQNANFSMFERGNAWFEGPRLVASHPRVVTISHHLAHAYSAIGTSPFDEAAVLVIDGCGNAYDECLDRAAPTLMPPHEPEADHLYFEKDSYYGYSKGELAPIVKDYSVWGYRIRGYSMCPPTTKHSIGGLYQAVSSYCLGGIDDSGKLMGLAPYGRLGVFKHEVFSLSGGRVFVNYDWMAAFDRPCRGPDALREHFQYYADIARWVQAEIERALLYLVDHRYDLWPSENLAYAGGVALNAVANRRILHESKFRRLYVQPAAGDNGLAVGCAYYGWLHELRRERRRHAGSSCFGVSYPDADMAGSLARRAERLDFARSPDVVERAAQMLAAGKVIGWFQGASEFGPRALGHRSILADPRRPGVRDFINARVKRREDFRPFAPSVLEEDAASFFDCTCASPYMLLVAPARPERRDEIGSVIHLDGSGRLQTVSKRCDPVFHSLLLAFKRLTGLPVLLNTSFNRRRMPIVETPADAIEFFLDCDLDALIIGGFVVTKKSVVDEKPRDPALGLRYLTEVVERFGADVEGDGGACDVRITGVATWTVDTQSRRKGVVADGTRRADAILELSAPDFWRLVGNPAEMAPQLVEERRLKISGSIEHAASLMSILQKAAQARFPLPG